MTRLFFLLLSFTCLGCGPSSFFEWTRKPESLPRLSAEGVYVCVPSDRAYEDQANEGSGRLAAKALVTALGARVNRVGWSSSHVSSEQGLTEARAGGYEFMLFPTILHWEERATNWSGKLDRLRLRLDLIDVATGDVSFTTTVDGEGASGEGGDHVQHLLPIPLRAFAEAVF